MLPKNLRLKRKQVTEILETGATRKTKLFILRIKKSEERENQFGITTSKRLSKKAVERNKLRRRIYESIRKNLNRIDEKAGINLVIIPKKICLELSYQEIEKEITYILPNLTKWANT